MTEEEFWALVSKADMELVDQEDCGGGVAPIVEALSQKSPEDICRFHEIMSQKLYALDHIVLADEFESGGDSFLYQRCYIVASGHKKYKAVFENGEAGIGDLDWCESLIYVAQEAWNQSQDTEWQFEASVSFETGSNQQGYVEGTALTYQLDRNSRNEAINLGIPGNLHFGFATDPGDLGTILDGIAKIISYQLSNHLVDRWHKSNPDISVQFISQSSLDYVRTHNEKYFSKRMKINLAMDEVSVADDDPNDFSASFSTEIDFTKFDFLLAAVEMVDEGVEFAIPVNNIRKISPDEIIEVRKVILDEIFKALSIISKEIGADIELLEKTCEAVKREPWFIEREMGDVVLSRGKNPRKAQLIGRWEPDYVYHTARIFDDVEGPKDILFMIYWRMVGIGLLRSPGRLSWIDKETSIFHVLARTTDLHSRSTKATLIFHITLIHLEVGHQHFMHTFPISRKLRELRYCG